jgi:hypothetical protein
MIKIEKWSQEALLNRGKYMVYDLGFIDDESRVSAYFYPSYIELDSDEDDETRFIIAYGTYQVIIDNDKEDEVFGKLDIELIEHVKVEEDETIDYYLHRKWDNFVITDSNVLEFLERI